MKVLILPDAEAATDRAAGLILEEVAKTPRAILGLATGGTMEPLYSRLVSAHRSGARFDAVTTFNLDEYVGLAPDHPQSYHSYMRRHLFAQLGIGHDQTHLPRGDADDPDAEAVRYDAAIQAAGGIDLQLLGLGRNGHIGFNEPTSSLASSTRIKTLTQSTRDANRRFFDEDEAVPKFAITMGIGTILNARRCLMLATGAAKADAVARMIEGPVSAACPASALQLHAQAVIVIDRAAAAQLSLIDYYEYVHPDGEDPTVA